MTAKSLKIKATRMPRAQVNIAFLDFGRKTAVKCKITIFDVKARINQVVCRSKYGAATVVVYQRKVFEMRVAVGVYIIENQNFKELKRRHHLSVEKASGGSIAIRSKSLRKRRRTII